MNSGSPAVVAPSADFMFGTLDSPPVGRDVLYIEGTSGVGKTTALRLLQEQSNGQLPEGTFVKGDLLNVTDAPGYQLLVGHRCECDRDGVCTVDLGDERFPRCPGPAFITKCYEGMYMRNVLGANAQYLVVDRNCTFSGFMYSQVRVLCAEVDADHDGSPTELLRGEVRVRAEVLQQVREYIRCACLLFRGDRFIIVLNCDPQGVEKMFERQYFDVQGRSASQVQQYLDVQNWVFEYAHECLSGSALLVGDGHHYDSLRTLILERYQAMVDEGGSASSAAVFIDRSGQHNGTGDDSDGEVDR